MAKWKSPLFSDIRNKLGDNVVFGMWKGRPYMRSYVVPSNPQTDGQMSYRFLLDSIVSYWQTNIKPTPAKVTAWNTEALKTLVSGYNLFVKTGQGADIGTINLSVAGGVSIEIKDCAIPASDFTVMKKTVAGVFSFPTTKRGPGTYVAADYPVAPAAGDTMYMANTRVGGVAGAEATPSLDLAGSKWKRNSTAPYAPQELTIVA
jgi:hypothetical protein